MRSSFLAASDEPMIGTETPAARTAKIVVMTSSMRRNLRAEGVPAASD